MTPPLNVTATMDVPKEMPFELEVEGSMLLGRDTEISADPPFFVFTPLLSKDVAV